MCRNIKTLYNFEPPATDEEIRAAALQYVRKISGSTSPSAANQEAFDRAVDEVARASATLLGALVTSAAPKDREVEAARARERAVRRFGASTARSAARGAMKLHLVDGTYELFRSHFGAPPRQDAERARGRRDGRPAAQPVAAALDAGSDARGVRLRPRRRVVPQRAVRRLQDERRRRPGPAGASSSSPRRRCGRSAWSSGRWWSSRPTTPWARPPPASATCPASTRSCSARRTRTSRRRWSATASSAGTAAGTSCWTPPA